MSNFQTVFTAARDALDQFAQNSDICADAVDLIVKNPAPLLISGVGKSGLVGQKIASTFRSLGKQAFFIHSSEASHGDLGSFHQGSVVIMLSNSGETSELSDLIHFCQANDNPIIAITGRGESSLAKASTIAIVYGPLREADPNGLAPTTSTTLMMAIGDALAIGYADQNDFNERDFAHYHPGGNLGARLRLVRDVMRSGDALPLVDVDCRMAEAIIALSEKTLGMAVLMQDDTVFGVLTDGDLRRHIDELDHASPRDLASREPFSVPANMSAHDCAEALSARKVMQALVFEDGKLAGIVHMHDLLRSS